jgi:hypothetical protein
MGSETVGWKFLIIKMEESERLMGNHNVEKGKAVIF